MKRVQLVSVASSRWMIGRTALAGIVALAILAAPARSQDAGVSGIPPGPANARGLNGSLNDPSGVGNAARVPAIPPPAISPVTTPSASPPIAYRGSVQGVLKIRRTRYAKSRVRRAERAAVRDNDRLLGKIPSICKGC